MSEKNIDCKAELDRDMKEDTKEQPFSCDICGKSYRQKKPLNRHTKIHSGERPFSCEVCGKDFVEKRYLKDLKFTHNDEGPFSCDLCGKTYVTKNNLRGHMRIHTDQRPLSCEVCRKAFRQKGNLKRHVSIHSREQPTTIDEAEGKKKFEKSHVELKEKHTGEMLFMFEDINMSNNKKEIPCKDVEYESHIGSEQFTSSPDLMMIMSTEFIKTEPSDMEVIDIKDENIDIKEEAY